MSIGPVSTRGMGTTPSAEPSALLGLTPGRPIRLGDGLRVRTECRPNGTVDTPLAVFMDNFSPDWNGGVVEDVVVDNSYDAVQWLLDHGVSPN